MRNPRAKRLIFCSLFLAILISTVAVLSCHAEDYPDISKINPNFYLNANQQFFHRPDSGYALISTDSSSITMASLLNSNGDLDYGCIDKAIIVKFSYEKASLCGNFLYISGRAPDDDGCVEIERIDLNNGKCLMNKVINVDCDFTRDFSVDENGRISLVTVPIGSVIKPDTSASIYIFDSEHNNVSIDPQPADTASSDLSESSNTTQSTASSTTSSTASSQQSEENDSPPARLNFDGPVTVESLQKELDANALGQKLRVFTVDKKEVKGGNIGTGQIVETVLNGKTESRYTAVIPGDLDGTGTVTEDDCQILYKYFTKSPALGSSVLSGPFFDAAKINNDKKIDPTRQELHPSDLLKIKKLIK